MRWAILILLLVPQAPAQRPRLSRKPTATEDPDVKNLSLTGVVLQVEAASLMIDATDHRILTFKITKSTHMPTAPLRQGDHVRVEATQDLEAFLTANEVAVDKVATEKAVAAESDSPAPITASNKPAPVYKPAKPDPEDEGPPRLRHGQPNPAPARPVPVEEPETKLAKETPREVPADSILKGTDDRQQEEKPKGLKPEAELIERAREWALSFTETLPNYVCQQFTTRYQKIPGEREWQAKDVVSANVVYEHGREDYRNIAINGKAQSKKMEELPGSWSTGEFGTTLRSLFHPGRRASFRFVKTAQIIGMTASVYDYSVKRENSDWRVQLGGQAIVPAYSGRVWIDQKTARVIRIEMQADEIPKDFPLDRVEAANDYGLIRLATADQFMLPLHAETLSCERGTTFCSRNAIEFRNYRKFSGEAVITFQ